MLEEFAAAHPNDAFALYGLAMECAKSGESDAAIAHFQKLLAAHPDYVAGYFHYGQLLTRLLRNDEARQILAAGIAAAGRTGDQHAGSEMQAALDSLN